MVQFVCTDATILPCITQPEGLSLLACSDCLERDHSHLSSPYSNRLSELPKLYHCLQSVVCEDDYGLTRYVAALFGRRCLMKLESGDHLGTVSVGINTTELLAENPFRKTLFSNRSPIESFVIDEIQTQGPLKILNHFISRGITDEETGIPLSIFSIAMTKPILCRLPEEPGWGLDISDCIPTPSLSPFLRSHFGLPSACCSTGSECAICRDSTLKDLDNLGNLCLDPARMCNQFFGRGLFYHFLAVDSNPETPSLRQFILRGTDILAWHANLQAGLFLDRFAALDSGDKVLTPPGTVFELPRSTRKGQPFMRPTPVSYSDW